MSAQTNNQPPKPVVCFSVVTDADPSAMPRVMEVFALRSVVPMQWHGARINGGTGDPFDDQLAIDIQVTSLDQAAAALIGRKLESMTCVQSVLLTEKS